VFANPGFGPEFATRLLGSGGATGPFSMGRMDVLLQQPAAFALLCDEFAVETKNLEVRFHTEIDKVSSGSAIESVGICCGGLCETVEPRALVDASGDAVVAALSGADFETEDSTRLQRPAIIFVLQGVDPSVLCDGGRMKVAHRIVTAVRDGRLPKGALGASLRATAHTGEVFVTLDLEGVPGEDYNPCNPKCRTVLEMHGRKLAAEIAAYLRGESAGFQDSFLATYPARIGIRESRRITGLVRIETEDILRGSSFEDSVALATWPMELRERATGPLYRFPENGCPCGIPLRALRSKSLENLIMAGRCISSSHEAQASLRVIGTCMATGEAAGIAAALMASGEKCDASAVVAARENIVKK